jgi:hypothetical protein
MRKRSSFLEHLRRKQQAAKLRDEELPLEAFQTAEEILGLKGQEFLSSRQEHSQRKPWFVRGRPWK